MFDTSKAFFDVGPEQAADSLPLGMIGGGLILDSGEAERTFLFRCQDRFFAYNSLVPLRTIFFAANDEHVGYYRRELELFREKWKLIARASQIFSADGPPEPLFVACDIDRLKLGSTWALLDQLRRKLLGAGARPKLYLNQISPTAASFVGHLDHLLGDLGIEGNYKVPEYQKLGDLALRFHSKAEYFQLVRRAGSTTALPTHVETALISPEQFLSITRWSELQKLYSEAAGGAEPNALRIKSTLDSSGNVSAVLNKDNFETNAARMRAEIEQHILCRGISYPDRVRELRGEVDLAETLRPLALADHRLLRYKRWQTERRTGIQLLLQRELESPLHSELFPGIGLSYFVRGPEDIELIAAAAQLYKDDERKHYLGSYLSPSIERSVLTPDFSKKMINLCRLFAEQGWRGPINFDARLNRRHEYELIYDCNPRLTAIYPPLAVRNHLRAHGLSAQTVGNIGYRGELVCEDIEERLAELSNRGLLYTRQHPRGAVILPNLCRRDGFDAVFVNLEVQEIQSALSAGLFSASNSSTPKAHA